MASTATTIPEDLFPGLPDPAGPDQIAEHTPWARRTIDRKIASGELPAYRLGRRVLVRKADLLALIQPVRAAG